MAELDRSKPYAIPTSRLARLSRLGAMTSGVVGSMAADGVQRFARGERPELRDLLLTPSNIHRITDQLAKMRGAAMKVGQLMSLDAGDMFPKDLSDILARLRAEADYMPPKQLKSVLTSAWGSGWLRRFKRFDITPIAAASIGQVHRAITQDDRDLAVKVQYPGVKSSIDSDVSNVGALVKLSGLLPEGLDLAPLLEAAKTQLHEEADYAREARYLSRFKNALADLPNVIVPGLHEDLSTDTVLAMDYVASDPIESLRSAPQSLRNRVTVQLLELLAREVFDLRLMQTDPNFANYRYTPDGGDLVLLDFGAAREITPDLAERYRCLMVAGVREDREAVAQAALALGFYAPDTAEHHRAAVLDMIALAFAPLAKDEVFDFADRDYAEQMQAAGLTLAEDRSFSHIPPVEVLFLQRKFAGMALLCRQLGAKVNVHQVLLPYLKQSSSTG